MNLSPRDYDLGKEYNNRMQARSRQVLNADNVAKGQRSITSHIPHINMRRMVVSVTIVGYLLLMMLFLASQAQAQEAPRLDPGMPVLSDREVQLVYLRWSLDSFAEGQIDTALDYVNDSIAIDETFALPYVVRSLILMSEDDVEAGLADAMIAIELHPTTEVGHYALAQAYEVLGEYALASYHYVQYVEVMAGNGSAGYLLVDYFTEGSSIDEALERAAACDLQLVRLEQEVS